MHAFEAGIINKFAKDKSSKMYVYVSSWGR